MDENYSGILLIGHGMKDALGTRAFLEIVDHVQKMLPKTPVEGAFLEFAQPTIAEGIVRLLWEETTHIAVVPMFLSALGHTMDDIPKAVAKAAGQYYKDSEFRVLGAEMVLERHKKVEISIKHHVGAHQRVVELSALRFQQALEDREEISAEETLLIIAAHGSTEPEAIEELTDFATRRKILTPVGRVEPCYAVLGKPQLADILRQSITSSYKRIVVQPHLLLKGRYTDMIRDQVETYRREYPDIDWIMTEPLGPDHLLAQAVAEIIKN